MTVQNTSQVTLSNITVNDPLTGFRQIITSLAPGETSTFTTTYAIIQNDVNRGYVDNTATASFTYRGVPYNVPASARVTANVAPSIDISKSVRETSYSGVNDILHYTIVVRNTGNVTLTNIVVTDPLTGLSQTIPSLAPGASNNIPSTYRITQNDLNNGRVDNTARARTLYNGTTLTDEASASVTGNQRPELRITKSARERNYTAPGEVIHYTFTVTNTGNVTLTGVTIDDPIADVACANDPFTLAPGAQVTCTGQHIVTPSDVTAGIIRNIAAVTGYDPGMNVVTSNSNEVIVTLNNLAPSISCPRPIITNTSSTTCDILINEGLAAMYSDPNDNVVSLTWVMTGATTASSPSTGINNLTSYTFNRGLTTVTYTVTDAFGLSASCSFTVSVVDNTRPTAICQDITVTLDINTGIATITVDDINNGSFDNCAIALMTISDDEFNCTDIGVNRVVLTVIDESGNISTCTANVTVNYADLGIRVSPAEDVICNGETTGLIMSSNAPATTWTWTASPSRHITGAADDNTGLHSVITQTLFNNDNATHNIIYSIIPTVYGQCEIPAISAEVWVNPTPQIEVNPHESVICYGESITLNVRNLNGTVQGQWLYDVRVIADPQIAGYTAAGTYTTPTNVTETLTNSGDEKHKVDYYFTPRIVPSDGGPDCIGEEQVITIWVHPQVKYTSEISNYNGFNVSCYGKSNGYIRLELSPNLAPYTFRWIGPGGFVASTEDISGLKAGEYNVTITDVNNCSTSTTFELIQPDRLSLTIEKSVSIDGSYNISCFGGQTGFANLAAVNNVGSVDYLWADGFIGSKRPNMSAGTYKIIITDSNNCYADSTVTLTQPDPIHVVFEKVDPFCPDSRDGEITPSVSGGISGGDYLYRWPDNSTGRILSNIPAGWYALSVTDMNTCTVTDSVRLIGMNEFCLIIPDAISPNRDLINDVWNIENIDLYPNVVITIYNRWGQVLWESDPGYPVPWNGRSRNEELPIDSYHYVIDLHNGYKPIVGVITIVR
jgi:gliding motility-associated-like protein